MNKAYIAIEGEISEYRTYRNFPKKEFAEERMTNRIRKKINYERDYFVDMEDLDIVVLNVEIWNEWGLKKGNIINIFDNKNSLRAKCKVENIIKVNDMNIKAELKLLELKEQKSQ
jgi:hypothetical protein